MLRSSFFRECKRSLITTVSGTSDEAEVPPEAVSTATVDPHSTWGGSTNWGREKRGPGTFDFSGQRASQATESKRTIRDSHQLQARAVRTIINTKMLTKKLPGWRWWVRTRLTVQ